MIAVPSKSFRVAVSVRSSYSKLLLFQKKSSHLLNTNFQLVFSVQSSLYDGSVSSSASKSPLGTRDHRDCHPRGPQLRSSLVQARLPFSQDWRNRTNFGLPDLRSQCWVSRIELYHRTVSKIRDTVMSLSVKYASNAINEKFSMFSGGFPLVSFTLPGAPQTGSFAEQK